jgi:putative transposase
MAQKRHKPEEILAKLRQVDVLLSQGRPVAEVIRSIGVTAFTHYRWRKEFGDLKSDQVKRLKELEKENERLRKAVSDLTLEKLILREAASGNFRAQARPALHRACHRQARHLRAIGVPGLGAASLDAEKGAERTGRRRSAYRRHHRAGHPSSLGYRPPSPEIVLWPASPAIAETALAPTVPHKPTMH